MPSAQISLRGDTPTGGLDVCLAVCLAGWQLAGWVSNYLIFPTRPPHPIIVAVRACHTEYGTHLGRPHTTSEMVLRAGVCLVPPCRHLILRAARKTSSITGSTRNPSFLGKIKVMTAERTNMRTVPAARCMSRIGDGGDGSWTVQLGGLMSGLASGGRLMGQRQHRRRRQRRRHQQHFRPLWPQDRRSRERY